MTAALDAAARANVAFAPNDDRLDAAIGGGLVLGTFGAAFSWKLDRLPRLAVAAGLTGMLAGSLGGAFLAGESPIGAPSSRLQRAAGAAIVGAGGGALVLAGIGGIVMPPLTSVTRFAAIREFALYGVLAGGALGAGIGALDTAPAARAAH